MAELDLFKCELHRHSGVSEERCGYRDELRTKQLGRSGQLSL